MGGGRPSPYFPKEGREMTIKTTNRIAKTIRELAGSTIFSVRFRKRTTGEMRDMLCRLKVTKDLSGEGRKYDALAKSLLVVYDVQKKGYRSIPLDSIQIIKVRGETYTINDEV